jgi:hypothetical protein
MSLSLGPVPAVEWDLPSGQVSAPPPIGSQEAHESRHTCLPAGHSGRGGSTRPVRYTAGACGATAILRRTLGIDGVGGDRIPCIGITAIDVIVVAWRLA